MKSNYYLDVWYCGIKCMAKPIVGRYYKRFGVTGKTRILRFNGELVGEGNAYAFLEYYLRKQPYSAHYKGVKLS